MSPAQLTCILAALILCGSPRWTAADAVAEARKIIKEVEKLEGASV